MLLERNRLVPVQKYLIYGLTCFLGLSGMLWFALDSWVEIEGEFGPVSHPMQHPTLVAHGCAGLAYLVLLGTLLSQHVWRGWGVRTERPQALLLVALQAILIMTAAGLYYLG